MGLLGNNLHKSPACCVTLLQKDLEGDEEHMTHTTVLLQGTQTIHFHPNSVLTPYMHSLFTVFVLMVVTQLNCNHQGNP